jgi:hypothetical protein
MVTARRVRAVGTVITATHILAIFLFCAIDMHTPQTRFVRAVRAGVRELVLLPAAQPFSALGRSAARILRLRTGAHRAPGLRAALAAFFYAFSNVLAFGCFQRGISRGAVYRVACGFYMRTLYLPRWRTERCFFGDAAPATHAIACTVMETRCFVVPIAFAHARIAHCCTHAPLCATGSNGAAFSASFFCAHKSRHRVAPRHGWAPQDVAHSYIAHLSSPRTRAYR